MSDRDLIVIPTNNGQDVLVRLLASFHGVDWQSVYVVDTGSKDDYLSTLPVQHSRTPYRGYGPGALLWAYWTRPDVRGYLLLQDSLVVTEDGFLDRFTEAMPEEGGAVAWTLFPMFFDPGLQHAYVRSHLPDGVELPAHGIFGPIFYTTRDSLDALNARGLLPSYPTTRQQAQGHERLWAACFAAAGMSVVSIAPEFNPAAMTDGTHGIFRKEFRVRP